MGVEREAQSHGRRVWGLPARGMRGALAFHGDVSVLLALLQFTCCVALCGVPDAFFVLGGAACAPLMALCVLGHLLFCGDFAGGHGGAAW